MPKIKQIILIFEKSSTTYPKIAQKEKKMLLFHFVFESLLIDSINLNFIERVSKLKRIILIFEKSSTTYPKIARRRSAEGKGDAVVPFRVRIVVDRFDKFKFHRSTQMSKIKPIILIFEIEENLRPLI